MKKRWNIGFCIDEMAGAYPTAIWTGMMERARQLDVNVILIAGGGFNSESDDDFQRTLLYNYLSSPRIDGFVLTTTVYTKYHTDAWVKDYFDGFGKPYTSIGTDLPGIPSVLIDNQQGLREMFDHLIGDHEYRRVAFIRGPADNDEAEIRFACYKEALSKYSLPFDPSLTAIGEFNAKTGRDAMTEILSRTSGLPDAVVAANDYMALGAMAVLTGEGYAVPQQCAVVGFDNINDGMYEASPLTTVAQPLGEQGAVALDMLIDKLEGKPVPETRQLGTLPVIRNSCGCLSPVILELSQPHVGEHDRVLEAEGIRALLPEWFRDAQEADAVAAALSRLLTDGEFDPAVEETLLHNLEAVLARQIRTDEPLRSWHTFLSSVSALLTERGTLSADIAALMQKLRMVVGEFAERQRVADQKQMADQFTVLQSVLLDLVSTFELNKLRSIIADRLPNLGFPSFTVSRYEHPLDYQRGATVELPERSYVQMAYGDGTAFRSLENLEFRSVDLLPAEALPESRQYLGYLQSISFGSTHFGLIVTEIGPRDLTMHETVASQIASAMQAAETYQENLRRQEEANYKRNEIEKLVQPIVESLRSVSEMAVERAEAMQQLSSTAHTNTKIIESSLSSIETMNARAREIQDMINGVLDISEQIHLLSINSSIEATRAGTQGRGFSVIAHEIKSLADATASTVNDIEQHLKGFIGNIDDSKEASWNTAESYRSMIGNVEQVTENFQTITAQMEDLAVKSRGILDVMDTER